MAGILPVVVGGVAAFAILLIALGLAGSAPVDPVQARLTQLGSMQAKNLEELELQQPFLERTLRPLASNLSGYVARVTSQSFTERTEKRLALAGHPGNLRVGDWLGVKAIGTIVGAILFFLIFVFGIKTRILAFALALAGAAFGHSGPGCCLGCRRRERQRVTPPQLPRPPAGQGAAQDAVPPRRLHLSLAVRRHPGSGDHPDRPEPGRGEPRRIGGDGGRFVSPTLAARNLTTDHILAARVETAGGLWAKFMGLMGRARLDQGDALWLPDSNGIHMMFMRFPIDAVFVGAAGGDGSRTVLSVHPNLPAG